MRRYFFDNTTPSDGGHIALDLNSDCIQFIIVNTVILKVEKQILVG